MLANRGVEIVHGDLDDAVSVETALRNVQIVILVTVSQLGDPNLKDIEFRQAKCVVDASVAAGASHIIFSTTPHARELWTGGPVDHFDSKAEIEDYIRKSPIRSSFFAPAIFMQNLRTSMAPLPQEDGTYAITNIVHPNTPMAFLDIDDIGKYVAVLLHTLGDSDEKLLCCADGFYSFQQLADIISRVSGKEVRYVQVEEEDFARCMPPVTASYMCPMLRFFDQVGYFGPDTHRLVLEGRKCVSTDLTTFEEFAHKHLRQL